MFSECSVEELKEMIPSFCQCYNNLIYCQDFQVRLEANKGDNPVWGSFVALQIIGTRLQEGISRYVKLFVVSLQIYMYDSHKMVAQFSQELFTVGLVHGLYLVSDPRGTSKASLYEVFW